MTGAEGSLRLVADIGGTNARFAVSAAPGQFNRTRKVPVARYANLADAVAAYRGAERLEAPFREILVAAAGPVEAGAITMTNCPWHIRAGDLADFAGPRAPIRLLNDLEAVAHALPHVKAGDLETLRAAGESVFQPTRLAVNLGTGFGAALARRAEGSWHVAASEAGHMAFAARSEEEWALRGALHTVEDALSGPGLARLYRLIADGKGITPATPENVFARLGRDSAADRALSLFTRLLGRVAGDLVLATAAGGGVYLCGGCASGWRAHGDLGEFFEAFCAKGPMAGRMAHVPVHLITAEDPALLGLTHAFL